MISKSNENNKTNLDIKIKYNICLVHLCQVVVPPSETKRFIQPKNKQL